MEAKVGTNKLHYIPLEEGASACVTLPRPQAVVIGRISENSRYGCHGPRELLVSLSNHVAMFLGLSADGLVDATTRLASKPCHPPNDTILRRNVQVGCHGPRLRGHVLIGSIGGRS